MIRRRRPLLAYVAAQGISVTGTRISTIALPWFALTTTGSATKTGLVAFAEMAPLVAFQALSGPLADRVSPRRLAIACNACSILAVAAIPLTHATGVLTFPLLLVLVAVAGALRGPGDAAQHAMTPAVADQTGTDLSRVTGLAGAVERTASLTGAGIAAGLIGLLGPADALLVDAGSFLVAAVLLLAFTDDGAVRERSSGESYLGELRAGWTFMRRDPILMGLAVMIAVTNLLDQAWSAVLVPVWARDSGAGVAGIGVIGVVWGVAAVAGSACAAAAAHRLPRFAVFVGGFLVAGLPRYAALALHLPWPALCAVLVAGGFGSGFLNPILGAVMFERIPREMVGRASAMSVAMSWSLMPFGGILGGVLIAGIGISPALLVVGAAYFLATMSPVLDKRLRGMDEAPQGAPELARVDGAATPSHAA